MKRSTRIRSASVVAAAAALAASTTLPSTAATSEGSREAPAPTVLARHLLSPLSLAVTRTGVSFVSQNFGGPIVKVSPGHPTAEVTGGDGEFGGLSRRGRTLTFVVTGEGSPTQAVAFVKTFKDGKTVKLGNLGRAETNRNPDADVEYGFTDLSEECASQIDVETFGPPAHTGVIESHPYATAKIGGTTYVADAAANVIWSVTDDGPVRVRSLLPPVPAEVTADLAGQFGLPECTIGETFLAEPVPTDVEVGPDGMLYVTTLAGEIPDAGAVYSIDPADGTTTEVFGGLFAATGLAIDKNGDMYVAMLFPGVILRIPAGEGPPEEFASINQPAALEIADGHLYATVNVLAGPNGKLVRWAL